MQNCSYIPQFFKERGYCSNLRNEVNTKDHKNFDQ
ncbi:hypothetical protein [Klebsiella phage vB_KpnM-VAC66]|nr:hypothetical protein [Klebsiella phage vB_KpnM-VAC66]WMX18194.1 hypothetical protein [Klebsiella phage KpF2]